MKNDWQIALIPPSLEPNRVHIWLIPLLAWQQDFAECYGRLSPTEQQRADRYHFDHHRLRYTLSQGLLRQLMGHYLQCDPQTIAFAKGEYGKPFIEESSLHFNVSHSGDYALFGFSCHQELGVDIEAWRERKYLSGIIDSQFSTQEAKIYHSLPKTEQVASFYQGWSCKEAYIKAIGMGLSFPLKAFSVEMDPKKPAQLLEAEWMDHINTQWHLTKLAAPEDYSIAIALAKADINVSLFLYQKEN